MNSQERGDATEARGFRALSEIKDMEPDFVLDVRQSSPEMDARGIDCLVQISLPAGSSRTRMTVPVEFKSSERGAKKWKAVHSDLHQAGVLIFFLPESLSPRKVRRLIFRALKRVQLNSRDGTLYHSMFQRLFVGGSKNLKWIVHAIKARRARRK